MKYYSVTYTFVDGLDESYTGMTTYTNELGYFSIYDFTLSMNKTNGDDYLYIVYNFVELTKEQYVMEDKFGKILVQKRVK